MKNCRVNLKIENIIPGNSEVIELPMDVGLVPFYAAPEDILLFFSDEGSTEWVENFERVVNLVFNGSRSFDRLLAYNSITIGSDMTRMAIAEKYTICYATYWAGIKLFKDRLKSISKTKNLGDFGISYRGDKDNTAVEAIIKDAKKCLDDIGEYISELSAAEIGKAKVFMFRKSGAKVSQYSTRRWDYMTPELGIAYAGNKRVLQDGSSYKTGAFYQYWMIGKLGYDNWGFDGNFTW